MIKYWDYLSEYKFLKTKISYTVNKVFESGTLLFGKELKNNHVFSILKKGNIPTWVDPKPLPFSLKASLNSLALIILS